MNMYRIINACECAIFYKDTVCLQFRSELNTHYPNYYCFPGGSLDENEDPISAVKREVMEETGIDLSSEQLSLSVIEFNYHDDENELWVIYTFRATLSESPKVTSSKEGNISFYNIKEASSLNLVPQTKSYFNHTISSSNRILLINRHFVKDIITETISETFV